MALQTSTKILRKVHTHNVWYYYINVLMRQQTIRVHMINVCSFVSPAKKQQKKSTPASGSDSEFEQKNPTSTNQETGWSHNAQSSTECNRSMIEKGDCLQDVHITLANALYKQSPDRAGFQLTLYVANGRCIPQKEAKYTLMKWENIGWCLVLVVDV